MKSITTIGCVGAGLIGQGWATQFCSAGYDLVLYDVNNAVLESALGHIESNLTFLEAHEFIGRGETAGALKRIRTTCSLAEAVGHADYVQESVSENYAVKKQIFKEMDLLAPAGVILASSSSGLLMTEIQKAVALPQRCVLVHPYLPVYLMPLVEVVGGRQTTPDALATACDLMETVGKVPVLLQKEVSGYIVNRLQAALLREAIDLVDSGVASAEAVDKAFRLSLGLRGPLLRAHLAADGIERFFENYAASYRRRWESMAVWNAIPDRAAAAVAKSVNTMESVRTKSLPELKTWRDEMLVKILKLIDNGKPGP